jgi:hypothetical protein
MASTKKKAISFINDMLNARMTYQQFRLLMKIKALCVKLVGGIDKITTPEERHIVRLGQLNPDQLQSLRDTIKTRSLERLMALGYTREAAESIYAGRDKASSRWPSAKKKSRLPNDQMKKSSALKNLPSVMNAADPVNQDNKLRMFNHLPKTMNEAGMATRVDDSAIMHTARPPVAKNNLFRNPSGQFMKKPSPQKFHEDALLPIDATERDVSEALLELSRSPSLQGPLTDSILPQTAANAHITSPTVLTNDAILDRYVFGMP